MLWENNFFSPADFTAHKFFSASVAPNLWCPCLLGTAVHAVPKAEAGSQFVVESPPLNSLLATRRVNCILELCRFLGAWCWLKSKSQVPTGKAKNLVSLPKVPPLQWLRLWGGIMVWVGLPDWDWVGGSMALPWGLTVADVSNLWPFALCHMVSWWTSCFPKKSLWEKSGRVIHVQQKIRTHCPQSPQAGNSFPTIWIG